jgi:monovalent cation:H+ antiporter-2, CPA2 family
MTMPPAEGQDPNPDGRPPGGHAPGGHAIIAGFGLAGRATANALIAKGIPLYVIERNVDTVRRCATAGLRIVEGDATDEKVLLAAGIETAVLFAATMPNDHAVLEAVAQARRLNPSVRIFARCEYVSTGMKATKRGADEVVIAEKAVATEFGRLVEQSIPAHDATEQRVPANTPEMVPGTPG